MAALPRCGAAGGGEEGGSAAPANKLTDSGIHVGAPDTRQTGPGPPCADRLHITFILVMASQENKALCLDKIHVCLLRGSLCVLISPLSEGCSVHSANIFTLSIISHTATNSQK